MVKQILLVCTLGNVQGTVWRICILMLGCRGCKCFQNLLYWCEKLHAKFSGDL